MAEAQAQRRGGVLSRLVLWLLVLCLLAAVWWLASERNQRRFAWRPDESVLTISKGRFFPLGMANLAPDDPQFGKIYGPLPIPQGSTSGWPGCAASSPSPPRSRSCSRQRSWSSPPAASSNPSRRAAAITPSTPARCPACWKASKASSKTPPNPNPTPRHPRHRPPPPPPPPKQPQPPPPPDAGTPPPR